MIGSTGRRLAIVAVVFLAFPAHSDARPGRGGRRAATPARSGPRSTPAYRTSVTPHSSPARPSRPGSRTTGSRPGLPEQTPHGPGGQSIRPADRPSAEQLQNFVDLPSRSGAAPQNASSRFDTDRTRPTGLQLQSAHGSLSTAPSWAGGPQPFTPAWYLEHPNAWKVTHPYAPAAAVGFAGVAAWVGLQGQAAAVDYGDTSVVNYYPAEEGYEEHQQQVEDAAELAETGQAAEAEGPWMPLGVFALLSPGQTEPHTIVQLAVNRQRVVQGNHFDVLTEASHPIHGSIDPTTQQTAWTAGGNERVVYQTDLASLTEDAVPLLIHFGDQQTQRWTMIRTEQEAEEPATP